MDRIRRDTLLGLVFFGSLAFLLWATVNLTDTGFGTNSIVVAFDQAGSCEVGTNVMVLGKKIGKVTAIDVDFERTDKPVTMTLRLREPIPLKTGYAISVRDQGVLGGKQLFIDPGRGAPLAATAALVGSVEPNAFEAIGGITKGEGELGKKLLNAVDQFGTFFGKMNDPETSIGRLVNSKVLHETVLEAVDRLRGVLLDIQEGRGTLGDLVVNSDTRNKLQDFLTSLRSIGKKLDEGTDGVLGVLLNDKEAASNLQSIVRNVDLIVGNAATTKGAIGRLLNDEELGRQLASVVANLDRLTTNLTNPDAGALGALTSDPQTAADIKATLASLREITEHLTRNDGLLGVLINDRDLAMRFRRILTQVSRALEDAREAAPIGNFIQVLLGAF
ncbi:MAG: MlaD family protein [Planctomycetota bacterium]